MTQDKWRTEKDYDEVSRELTGDPIRFNYHMLKNKGVFLSMTSDEEKNTDTDGSETEKSIT